MQDRANLSNSEERAVEELDPLAINENMAVLRKIRALIASNPGIQIFETSQNYEFVLDNKDNLVKLTKPLKLELQTMAVDLDVLGSLSAEESAKFATFLRHLKQYSINTKERIYLHKDVVGDCEAHLFAFEDESGVVVYRKVQLTKQLVVYPRKKDPADRRFAILGEHISRGSYGSIFSCKKSLSLSPNNRDSFTVKDKNTDKCRVAKLQQDRFSRTYGSFLADNEYQMTSILAPELAVKPPAKHAQRKFSALLLRHVPGKDLLDLLNEKEIQSDLERLQICLLAAEALKLVHERGGIHRDIKPDNLIICKGVDGQYIVKFIDYGLSMLQANNKGGITGSLIYIAPEVLADVNATASSDVYSLCRLFENIFGYYPSWEVEDKQATMEACIENASKPFDRDLLAFDKSNGKLLEALGWSALLNGMRTQSPVNRMKLDEVIGQLKSLIQAFKAANEPQSVCSSAAAAASVDSELNLKQDLESCTHNRSTLRP